MKQILFILGASVALFIIIQQVSGQSVPIKCYQCNSFYDKGCADFFDNKTYPLIPCPINATKCRKIIQETYYDGMWDVRYIRQCAITGEVGPAEGRWCKERMGTWRVKVKYCHCDNKDGCNSAGKSFANYTFISLLLLFGLLCTKRNIGSLWGS